MIFLKLKVRHCWKGVKAIGGVTPRDCVTMAHMDDKILLFGGFSAGPYRSVSLMQLVRLFVSF